MSSIITLLTDFGTQDGYAGVMKGVILGIHSEVTIVDISHDIPQWNLKSAAFILQSSYRYFPKGTIHVIVVDPGVGSSREIIAVQTQDYLFLAPDNGVLSVVLMSEQPYEVHRISGSKANAGDISQTFHGRDVFAPVAAHLSKGASLTEFGELYKTPVQILIEDPVVGTKKISGKIEYRDRFGNLISNIREKDFKKSGITDSCIATINGRSIRGLTTHYAAVTKGSPLLLFSSSGYLEIACNAASAAKILQADIGDTVELLE
jgi:S-adenosylmethionine hydrolase